MSVFFIIIIIYYFFIINFIKAFFIIINKYNNNYFITYNIIIIAEAGGTKVRSSCRGNRMLIRLSRKETWLTTLRFEYPLNHAYMLQAKKRGVPLLGVNEGIG